LALDRVIPVVVARLKEENADIEAMLWPDGSGTRKKRLSGRPIRPCLTPCAGGILPRQSSTNATGRRNTGQ
jgi:hypothetical protein